MIGGQSFKEIEVKKWRKNRGGACRTGGGDFNHGSHGFARMVVVGFFLIVLVVGYYLTPSLTKGFV